MSGSAELAALYSAIEESARLLDVPCSHDKVWTVLNAYGDALTKDAVIAFRVATGARHIGELDCRMLLPKEADPYALAVAKGLTEQTDHPVGALLSDITRACPVDCYGVDFGVVAGFTKTWSFFPGDDLQRLSHLADIASMPRSVAEHVDFFTRHGLDDTVSLIGIDYRHRTVNLYFGTPPAECFRPATIQSMFHDLRLPEPSEQLLALGQQAFGIYATLGWDSLNVERMCYSIMTADPTTLPVELDPVIERFIKGGPHDATDRRFVYAVASSAAGEYHKLQSYYQWRPHMLDVMLLSDSVEYRG
jgi:hypothetical protein